MIDQYKNLSKSPIIIEDSPPLITGYPCDFNGVCPFTEYSTSAEYCKKHCGLTPQRKADKTKEDIFNDYC